MEQRSFFGLSEHLERLSQIGDPLEVLEQVVDFEYFRGWLVEGLGYGDGTKGGWPPFDPASMFEALILQAQHHLSDAKMEFMIRGCLSWVRCLRFDLGGPTPDENTIRHFRNRLTETGTLRRVMKAFDWQLQKKGYIAMSGQIVDASLVPAPKQRNNDGEKEAIKAGKIRDRPDGTPLPQIALPVFGYKSHIAIDRRSGFIRESAVTSASQAEGRMLPRLVTTQSTSSEVWADSAYRSQKNEKWLAAKLLASRIHRASRRGGRCRSVSRKPVLANRRSGQPSSTSSSFRRTGSACSSAPSVWRERRRNWPSPTSPTISTA